jgi:hypothetical protein
MNEQRQRDIGRYCQRLHRACDGKVRYPSKKIASARARILAVSAVERRPLGHAPRPRDALNAYKCPRCKRWHIGHSSPWYT